MEPRPRRTWAGTGGTIWVMLPLRGSGEDTNCSRRYPKKRAAFEPSRGNFGREASPFPRDPPDVNTYTIPSAADTLWLFISPPVRS